MSTNAPPPRPAPQLCMIRRTFDGLPPLAIPTGYRLAHWRPGDEAAWQNVAEAAFTSAFDFRCMRDDYAFRPERIKLIWRDQTPVATSSAWYRPSYGRTMGYLHWVAVLPSEGGKGLGLQVSLACLHHLRDEGRTACVLVTDDHRLPAIVTYLKLGFEPVIVHENQPQRWREVFAALGKPELATRHEAALTAAAATFNDRRDDLDSAARYRLRTRWLPEREHRAGKVGSGEVAFLNDERLYKPSDCGRASCSPRAVTVGSPLNEPLVIRYEAGPAGLPAGAVVRFYVRGQSPLGFNHLAAGGTDAAPLTLAAPPGRVVEAQRLGFVVREPGLRPGEVVTLTLGPQPALHWSKLAFRREFHVGIAIAPSEPERLLPEPMVIDFLPEPAAVVQAILPATRRPGDAVTATLRVCDRFDNPAPSPLGERDGVRGEPAASTSPSSSRAHPSPGLALGGLGHPLPLGERGREAIDALASTRITLAACKNETIRITPADIARTSIAPHAAALPVVSNVCVPSDDLQLYIGDLHCHDMLSESEGYGDRVHQWAREQARLDFVSVTPQCHNWIDHEKWTLVKYMNQRYLDEGRFVTFLGFEWQHAAFGDKVVHFLGGTMPFMPVDDPRTCTPGRLYEALRQTDATVISHHPGYPSQWVPGTDYEAVETDLERVIELWSMHGSSEGYDPADRPLSATQADRTVYAALRRGVRLGFVAGSDNHSARPGGSAQGVRPYWGGLAAVWAPALTRRDLFTAIRARRTYALTRSRIVLRFTVNGAWMGSELAMTDRVTLKLDAWAPTPIAKVELMRDAQVWKTTSPGSDEAHVQKDDRLSRPAFYHARVTLADGNLAVCSPVWVG